MDLQEDNDITAENYIFCLESFKVLYDYAFAKQDEDLMFMLENIFHNLI